MNINLLSIIIPIYKQEKTIKKELENLYDILSETPYDFEIIGVVDGTELDNSLKEAKKVKKKNVKIYGYKSNYGKGQAVRYGMQKAKGDVVTFIDSGGDIDPKGIEMLLVHMEWYDADIIIGSKLHSASKVENYPFFRKMLTFGYYLLVKMLFRLNVRDTQTGLKAYKKDVLNDVLDKLVIKRFVFDIEILAVAHKEGYYICDAPVNINFKTGNSSLLGFGLLKSIFKFILDTSAVWYRMYILRYYEDGRKRERSFNKELDMWVNTGGMTDRRQVLIDFVNKYLGGFIKFLSKDRKST